MLAASFASWSAISFPKLPACACAHLDTVTLGSGTDSVRVCRHTVHLSCSTVRLTHVTADEYETDIGSCSAVQVLVLLPHKKKVHDCQQVVFIETDQVPLYILFSISISIFPSTISFSHARFTSVLILPHLDLLPAWPQNNLFIHIVCDGQLQ